MQFSKVKELEDAYTEVSKFCELILRIPAKSSSVECNYSIFFVVEFNGKRFSLAKIAVIY